MQVSSQFQKAGNKPPHPGTQQIPDWVGPRSGLDALEKKNISTSGQEFNNPSAVQPMV
jgi:hypothetical protein